jgi:HEAT repeat protein
METELRSAQQSVPAISWEMLEKSLAHPNALIRQKAIEVAGRTRDPRAVEALQALVRDENPAIRSTAAQALVHSAKQHDPATEAALAQLITSAADDELRVFLISNVALSGGDILLRAVIASLVDPAANIRHAAEIALKNLGGSWMIADVAAEMLPAIEGAKSAFNVEVSAAATRWIAQLQRAQLRRTMLNSGLATALTLTGALQSPNALMRTAAAEALQQTNDPRAMPALRDALRDHDEQVRRAAATALGHLQWQPNTEEEFITWLVAMGRWDSAVAHGDAAVDAVLLAAKHSGAEAQAKAVECLAKLNSMRAMLPLVPLLGSPHAVVRRAVAHALKSLDWIPPNDEQAIRHAIELEDWTATISFGADAVPALMTALKALHSEPERRTAVLTALEAIADPRAANNLVSYCRDGEVAAAAASSLQQLLERSGSEVSEETLHSILTLKNVVQFQFTFDSNHKQTVRSGLELLDIAALRELAVSELARREATPAPQEVAATGEEAA